MKLLHSPNRSPAGAVHNPAASRLGIDQPGNHQPFDVLFRSDVPINAEIQNQQRIALGFCQIFRHNKSVSQRYVQMLWQYRIQPEVAPSAPSLYPIVEIFPAIGGNAVMLGHGESHDESPLMIEGDINLTRVRSGNGTTPIFRRIKP